MGVSIGIGFAVGEINDEHLACVHMPMTTKSAA